MKVFFHSNGALLDSPYFNYTWRYSPKGVIYVSNKTGISDVLIDMKLQRRFKMLVGIGKLLLNFVGMSVVNVSNVPESIGKVDLIHSFNTIPMTKMPHIVEIEAYHSLFVGGAMDKCSVDRVRQLLLKKNCKKILFIKRLEHTFFCLQDFTFRAMPCVRDILPRCSRRYTLPGITFQRVINVVTFETYASYIFFWLCHDQFNSKDSAGCLLIFYPLFS